MIIEGPVRRANLSGDSFADLTDALLLEIGRTALTFDRDLTPEAQTAAWERMTSIDDTDQARRAALRAACAGGATNVDCLTAAYVLGDPMPDPVYPPPEPEPSPG